jgi:hypothetical protein
MWNVIISRVNWSLEERWKYLPAQCPSISEWTTLFEGSKVSFSS